jgi:DNA-binding Lrp family transcriptional regulator
MESALVLITIESSKDKQVLMELKKLDGVVRAHSLFGPYDASALVEAESLKQIEDVVWGHIRNIDGVKSTVTCFIAD